MKVTFWIETGFNGADYLETMDLPDNCTEETLEEYMTNYVSNHIQYGYYKEEE